MFTVPVISSKADKIWGELYALIESLVASNSFFAKVLTNMEKIRAKPKGLTRFMGAQLSRFVSNFVVATRHSPFSSRI